MQSIPVRNLFTIYFESTYGEVDLHLESHDNFFGLAFGDRRVEMKLYYREDDLASEWKCVAGAKAFKWSKKGQETSVPTDPSMYRFSLRLVEGIVHFIKSKFFIGCIGFASDHPFEAERFSPSFLLLPKNRNSNSNSDSGKIQIKYLLIRKPNGSFCRRRKILLALQYFALLTGQSAHSRNECNRILVGAEQ
jgi:hypothetical protein